MHWWPVLGSLCLASENMILKNALALLGLCIVSENITLYGKSSYCFNWIYVMQLTSLKFKFKAQIFAGTNFRGNKFSRTAVTFWKNSRKLYIFAHLADHRFFKHFADITHFWRVQPRGGRDHSLIKFGQCWERAYLPLYTQPFPL